MNGMPAARQRTWSVLSPRPPVAWSAMLASRIALDSGVSGAPCPKPQGLVWSNDGWPASPPTTNRFHWPFRLGYFEKSTTWALAVDAAGPINAIAPTATAHDATAENRLR